MQTILYETAASFNRNGEANLCEFLGGNSSLPNSFPLTSRPIEKKNLRIQRNPPLLFEKLGAKGGETELFSGRGNGSAHVSRVNYRSRLSTGFSVAHMQHRVVFPPDAVHTYATCTRAQRAAEHVHTAAPRGRWCLRKRRGPWL